MWLDGDAVSGVVENEKTTKRLRYQKPTRTITTNANNCDTSSRNDWKLNLYLCIFETYSDRYQLFLGVEFA